MKIDSTKISLGKTEKYKDYYFQSVKKTFLYKKAKNVNLTPDIKTELENIITLMLTDKKFIVKITVYTDAYGSNVGEYEKISMKRAETAANYLISKGIDKKKSFLKAKEIKTLWKATLHLKAGN